MAGRLESLDANEGLERRRHRHWYDRLMMLCDGVFAIAITLLGIDVSAPAGWKGDAGSLWPHLAVQLDAYATSFLVISIFWLAHRRFMAMILTVDAPVTVLTLVLLGLIALVPAATRLVSAYGTIATARMAYGGLIVAIGLVISALWAYAGLIARVVPREVGWRLRWFFLILMVATPPFFLLLVFSLSTYRPGVVPGLLAMLFLIGWRMRLWAVRRMGGKPYMA
jgi:uncharacterized membrane protein